MKQLHKLMSLEDFVGQIRAYVADSNQKERGCDLIMGYKQFLNTEIEF